MKLLCLNKIVPQMEHAPHKIYMLEFDHTQGELAIFSLYTVEALKTLKEFKDITDKTTINMIGVEGDKGGHSHENIKSTHALVVDFRPLGIYVLFWAKPTKGDVLKAALDGPLVASFGLKTLEVKKASGGKKSQGSKKPTAKKIT